MIIRIIKKTRCRLCPTVNLNCAINFYTFVEGQGLSGVSM